MDEVNGRAFHNHVSLGIYGDAVRSPAYRDAQVRTLLQTAAEEMRPSGEALAPRLVDDGGREHCHFAVVLVPNDPCAPGTHLSAPPGRLAISAPAPPGPRIPAPQSQG